MVVTRISVHAGVRVDSWIERGTTISPHYDSLLAKLMVFAPDRPAATKSMSAALAETQVGLLRHYYVIMSLLHHYYVITTSLLHQSGSFLQLYFSE